MHLIWYEHIRLHLKFHPLPLLLRQISRPNNLQSKILSLPHIFNLKNLSLTSIAQLPHYSEIAGVEGFSLLLFHMWINIQSGITILFKYSSITYLTLKNRYYQNHSNYNLF